MHFWPFAWDYVVHTTNRVSSDANKEKKTPFELFYERKPKIHYFKPFGCLTYTQNMSRQNKFEEKAKRCIFLSYAFNSKGFKLMNTETKKIIIAESPKFIENSFPGIQEENCNVNILVNRSINRIL